MPPSLTVGPKEPLLRVYFNQSAAEIIWKETLFSKKNKERDKYFLTVVVRIDKVEQDP